MRIFPMMTVAVDPSSTRTGVAFFQDLTLTLTMDVIPSQLAPKETDVVRKAILTWREILNQMNFQRWKIRRVIIEQPPSTVYGRGVKTRNEAMGKAARLTQLHQFYGALHAVAAQTPPHAVVCAKPIEWQSALLGKVKRGESKSQSIAMVKSIYPDYAGKVNADIADAINLGYWFLCRREEMASGYHE